MSKLLIINGYECPCPADGYEIIESTTVNAGRNANNKVIGQVVGRNMWKLNNIQWNGLSVDQWKAIKNAMSPFFVDVTFTDDCNQRHTLKMYPGDRSGTPLFVSGMTITKMRTCKFNLIDAGW